MTQIREWFPYENVTLSPNICTNSQLSETNIIMTYKFDIDEEER